MIETRQSIFLFSREIAKRPSKVARFILVVNPAKILISANNGRKISLIVQTYRNIPSILNLILTFSAVGSICKSQP